MRNVRALGASSVMQQMEDLLYHAQEKHGVEKKFGKSLSDGERQEVRARLQTLMGWPGRAHYVVNASTQVHQVMDSIAQRVTTLRQEGRVVSALFFDYLQKAQQGDSWREPELIVNTIWSYCVDLRLAFFIASQVNKGALEELQNGEIEGLTERQIQLLSMQKFNVVYSLNPVWENGLLTQRANIRLLKMSIADDRPFLTQIQVRTNLAYLDWPQNGLIVQDSEK
jgi:hypothetical protein